MITISCLALVAQAAVPLHRSRRDLISWNRQANGSRVYARNHDGGRSLQPPTLVEQFQSFYRQNTHLMPTGNTDHLPDILRLVIAEQDASLLVLTEEELRMLAALMASHLM